MREHAHLQLVYESCGNCVYIVYRYTFGVFVTRVKISRDALYLILKLFDQRTKILST